MRYGTIRKNGQRNREAENKKGQRHPFDAAQIGGNVRLRGRINGLKESLSEDSVIDNGPIDEPGETRRTVDLALPFRGARWAEEDQVPETKERFGFSVALLLFSESSRA